MCRTVLRPQDSVTALFSEVVTCKDGWNNAGGTIWLEAGKEYAHLYEVQSRYYTEGGMEDAAFDA